MHETLDMTIVDVMYSLRDFSSSESATVEAVLSSETQLRLSFAPEYREYLLSVGAVSYYGHILTGISPFPGIDVVRVTREEREFNPIVPKSFYVIEQTHIDGIVIWQDADGKIYQSVPGIVPQKAYSSLAEYVKA